MIQTIKKLFRGKVKEEVVNVIPKPKTDKEVDLIYVDKSDNYYYIYKSVTDLPFLRYTAAEIATKQADFNLTKEKFEKLMDAMIKSFDEQKYAELGAMLMETKDRLSFAAEEYTLLQLSCVFTLMNDENGDQYLSKEQERKVKAWENDEEAKNFFLHMGFSLTSNFQNFSDFDIVDYLRKQDEQLRFSLSRSKMNQ